MSHGNARTTVHGRRLIVERHAAGWPQAHIAAAMGISRKCVRTWVTRYAAEGEAGLADRSSRPHTSPRRIVAEVEEQIVAVRTQQRRGPACGGWEQLLFFAEGRVDGKIRGRFRGANFPYRRGSRGPSCPDLRAVIETDDSAPVLLEMRGYGRAYPEGRRQIVGSVLHLSDQEPYARLNDTVCACAGEVRAPTDPDQDGPDLVIDVAELIWEPISKSIETAASPGDPTNT